MCYSAEEGRHAIVPLDASIVDIYKDSHAVIFMINPFDRQSLQYVRYVIVYTYDKMYNFCSWRCDWFGGNPFTIPHPYKPFSFVLIVQR